MLMPVTRSGTEKAVVKSYMIMSDITKLRLAGKEGNLWTSGLSLQQYTV